LRGLRQLDKGSRAERVEVKDRDMCGGPDLVGAPSAGWEPVA
jgi:hypothetical protein